MKITDEMLSAFIDNELTESDQKAVAQALEDDPEVSRRYEALRDASESAVKYLSEIDDRPLPASLQNLLDGTSSDIDLEDDTVVFLEPAKTPAVSTSRWQLPLAASIALLIGFGTGMLSAPVPDGTQYASQSSGLIEASNPLHRILEDSPSGSTYQLAGMEGPMATPVLSFQTNEGNFCREVVVSGETSASRNLACRQANGDWHMIAMTATPVSLESGYMTAAGPASEALESIIDGLISGDPVGSTEEVLLIQRGWAAKP